MGAATFRVTRVLDYRPDQGAGFADLSSTLLINMADVPATELIQPGSRVSRAVLFAGNPSDVEGFREYLAGARKKGERLQSVADASPQIRASSDRAGRFLSLASIVSVLLSAIAVAMAARRYARRHLDSVALMKCMGASQGFVLRQTLLQLVVVASIVTVCGTIVGYLAQSGLAWLLRDLISGALPPPAPDAFWLGLVTAVAILVGFALPPLLQLNRVPPARVLRRNVEPPPLRFALVYGLAIGAVLALLYWLVRDSKLVTYVALGIGATFLLLAAAGWLLVRALRPLRGGVGVAWRYGLANISRRGRDSVVQIVAFGLGFMVLLLLALVRNDLLTRMAGEPACRRAELLHDQHPPRRGRRRACLLRRARIAANAARAAGARKAFGHQRSARGEAQVRVRASRRLRGARGEPDLVADAA